MKEKVNIIKSWMSKHKYLVVILAFLAVKLVDKHNLIDYFELWHEEIGLQQEVNKYKKQYKIASERLEELNADSSAIERIARERYLMKKSNEDVYVFKEDLE